MELPLEVEELLRERNCAHLAPLLPDGSPHSVPIWVGVEEGRVAFFRGEVDAQSTASPCATPATVSDA